MPPAGEEAVDSVDLKLTGAWVEPGVTERSRRIHPAEPIPVLHATDQPPSAGPLFQTVDTPANPLA